MKFLPLLLIVILFSCDTSSPIEGGTASPNFTQDVNINGNISTEGALVILYKADSTDSSSYNGSGSDSYTRYYNNAYSSVSVVDSAYSDADGNFEFKDIETGTYSISIVSDDSSGVNYIQNINISETSDSVVTIEEVVLKEPGDLRINIDETDSLVKTGLTKGDIYIILKSTQYKSTILGNGYVLFENLAEGIYLAELYTKDGGEITVVSQKEFTVISGEVLIGNMSSNPIEDIIYTDIYEATDTEYNEIITLADDNAKNVLLLEPIDEGTLGKVKIITIVNVETNDTLLYPFIYVNEETIFLPLNIEDIPRVDGLEFYFTYVHDERIYGFDAIPVKCEYIKISEATIIDENNNKIPLQEY